MDHETGFTRSQTQGYYKIINNIWRVGNLIPKSNQESKRVPRQTAKISETPQGGQSFTKVRDAPW